MVDGAQKYANGAFPTSKIKNHPIDVLEVPVSLADIKRAAQTGRRLPEPGRQDGLDDRLQLERHLHGGAVHRHRASSSPPRRRCSPATTYNDADERRHLHDVTAIVSGQVNGRVTVGAGQNIVVAGDIAPLAGGDDVIGLVAYSDLWVAAYAPAQLTWNAAVLVQTEHLAVGRQRARAREPDDLLGVVGDGEGR